jgi:hypothetical protein
MYFVLLLFVDLYCLKRQFKMTKLKLESASKNNPLGLWLLAFPFADSFLLIRQIND